MSSFKTIIHTLRTGWLIEYPGRHIDGPPDFFANADPARTHPMTKKVTKRGKADTGRREKETWDSDEDGGKMYRLGIFPAWISVLGSNERPHGLESEDSAILRVG